MRLSHGRLLLEVRDAYRKGILEMLSADLLTYALKPSVVFIMVAVVIFAFMLPVAHFVSSTFLFLLVMMAFYNGRLSLKGLFVYAIVSIGFVLFSVLVFKTIFKVLLP